MKKTKDAYVVNFKGAKLYFEFSYAGLKAIQKLAMLNNCDIQCKVVKVDINKEVNF